MEFDLSPELCKYLDAHLIIPLLTALESQPQYNKETVLRAKLQVVNKTALFSTIKETHEALGEDVPQDVYDREDAMQEETTALEDSVMAVFDFLTSEEVVETMKDKLSKPSAMIETLKPLGFNPSYVDVMRTSGKLYYDTGNYEAAGEMLKNFRAFTTDIKESINALWGLLACSILNQEDDFESAKQNIQLLTTNFDGPLISELSSLELLQQRAWLLHWSLYVFFFASNKRDSYQELLKMFLFDNAYINTINTLCPHLYRYLGVAALLLGREKVGEKNGMFEFVRLLRRKSVTYTDPIIDLITALSIDFDFDAAFESLENAIAVIDSDFFLNSIKEEFANSARESIFEMYCRVHSSVSLDFIAEKLQLSDLDAEIWIVNLIRKTDIRASINLEKRLVEIKHYTQSAHKQVLDKTRWLNFKTRMVADTLKQRIANQTKQQEQQKKNRNFSAKKY
eukprot:m.8303 g.8303  ORF g.8303 m.8303 type:complete len:453 (-) comp6073_c0_seq1:41-1399(-)